jgi:tetratricopeptide (TPR) repeat protein
MSASKWGAAQFNQAAEAKKEELTRNAVADYTAQLSNQSREILAKFAEVHKDDPVAYQDAANNYLSGTVSAIKNPELAVRVQTGLGAKIFSDGNALQEAYDVKTKNTQITNVTKEASDSFAEAERLIVKGDAIGARAELDTSIMALQEVARMNPDFDVDTAVADLERNYDGLQLKASVSNAADNGDFAAANQIIIDATKEVPSNFTEAQWEQTTNKARSALVKQKSLFDSVQATATAEDKAFVNSSLALMESGQTLSPENMVKLNNLAAGNSLAEKAITTATNTSVFIAMPDSQQLELIDAIDPSDPDTLMARNNVQKALRADSWGTAIQQNTITEEELADFAEFDVTRLLETNLTDEQQAEYQQAYQRNIEIAARLSEHYGFTFAPLDNQQIQTLTNAIPQMTPSEQVELAESIGPDSPMLNTLSKKNASLFAVAATIENSNTQRAIFEGQKRLNSGTVDPFKDVADGMRNQLFEVVGDTLGDDARTQTYEAAKAYYASTFVGENIVYNPSDFANSIEMITGKIRNVRGVKTIPPSYSEGNNDGTVDNLEGFIDDMDLETFLELGGEADPYTKTLPVVRSDIQFATPEPVTVEADRNLERMQGNNYKIRAAFGKNNYKFVTTQGIALKGADGNPLVINVNEERMNAYVASKNAKRMEKYGSFLESNRFARDVMGLFEPEGSPYFEATKAEEFTSTGQFAKELLTLGGLDGEKRTPVNQGMTRPDGSVKSEVGYLGPIVRDDGGVMTEYSTNVDDINAAFADSKFSRIDERG